MYIFADCWFIYKKRGKHTMKCLLDTENFVYAMTRKKPHGGANWRCLEQRKKEQKCPATASTHGGKIVYRNGIHNHPTNYDPLSMVICNNPISLDDFWYELHSKISILGLFGKDFLLVKKYFWGKLLKKNLFLQPCLSIRLQDQGFGTLLQNYSWIQEILFIKNTQI